MKFKIDKKILDATIHCKYNFECLQNENHLCLNANVDSCVNDSVHFINCNEPCHNYKISFGNSNICFCPTRKEIFNKYNL